MKNKRQETLLQIIRAQICVTQEDLQEKLNAAGFDVTQSTVSRDIKQLRIIKALDEYGNYRYMAPAQMSHVQESHTGEEYGQIFNKSAISVECAYNDIVIKCYTGMAQSACVAVDRLFGHEIMGSLAGDDTIFVIARSPQAAESLTERLTRLMR